MINAPITSSNLDQKFAVMMKVLNNELPMPDKIRVAKVKKSCRKKLHERRLTKGLVYIKKVAKALKKIKAVRASSEYGQLDNDEMDGHLRYTM